MSKKNFQGGVGEWLARALANAGVADCARVAFEDWPGLEGMATQFLQYVSPWLIVEHKNVAEDTLGVSCRAYIAARGGGPEAAHQAFISGLMQCVTDLVSVRVSVQDEDGLWRIWSYDEPLTTLMGRYKRYAIQIRTRTKPMKRGPVAIKLLAAISSTSELELAGLDIPTFASGGCQ